MANCVILGPNYVDSTYATVAFSLGDWQPENPASNVRDPRLVRAAVSRNVTLEATKILIDLGQSRDIRGAAIPDMVTSRDAQVRFSAYATADTSLTPIADSGWIERYQVIYPWGSLPFEDPHWLDGKMTEEERTLFPMPVINIWDMPQVARYWLVEVADTASALGSVGIPRIILAPGSQPSFNMIPGVKLVHESRTTVQESWGGAEYADSQRARRVVNFELDYLPEDEALTAFFDLQRKLDVDKQLFFAWDPADAINVQRRSFLGRMRTLNPLEAVALADARMNLTFEFAEIIG